jgi:hypothetical protein
MDELVVLGYFVMSKSFLLPAAAKSYDPTMRLLSDITVQLRQNTSGKQNT